MSKILPDHQIRSLIGSVIIGADETCINPNGIELRLGAHVHFESTGEQKKLQQGNFLQVNPGESIIISSLEKLDFSRDTVQKIFPDMMLMALITPTTTMMREGISQVSTKVDAGFRGLLNWGFRNSSTKVFTIQYAEPIFKLTLFLLDKGETPEVPYGDNKRHSYQDTEGIRLSARKIPAQIPKKQIVSSSFGKLDPNKQLREAGYPFDHISTELTALQGKWEVVSNDVRLLKNHFEKQTDTLSTKISEETKAIYSRLDDFRDNLVTKVESLLQKKFIWIAGVFVTAFSIIFATCKYLESKNISTGLLLIIALGTGGLVLLVAHIVSKKLT
jgi:deoxycytidine triphosphate deaminase